MKRIAYLSLFMSASVFLVAEQTEHAFRIPLPRSITRAVAHISNDNNHVITQNNTNTMHTPMSLLSPQASGPSWWDVFSSAAWQYKNKIAVGSLFAGYGALSAQLAWQASVVKRTDSWACWHAEVPLDTLRKIEPEILQAELLTSINEHYVVMHHDTTAAHAHGMGAATRANVRLFLHDVAFELEQLQSFFALYDWLALSRLAYLFPNTPAVGKQAHANVERLLFMQTTMIVTSCVQAG